MTRNSEFGLKPGTNYNHDRRPGPLAAVALHQARLTRCAAGEHDPRDVVVVTPRYVYYAPGGRRRPDGERFCQCCGAALDAGAAPARDIEPSAAFTANVTVAAVTRPVPGAADYSGDTGAAPETPGAPREATDAEPKEET